MTAAATVTFGRDLTLSYTSQGDQSGPVAVVGTRDASVPGIEAAGRMAA
jgi:hypothetical protein